VATYQVEIRKTIAGKNGAFNAIREYEKRINMSNPATNLK
jgi:hypothetical protein